MVVGRLTVRTRLFPSFVYPIFVRVLPRPSSSFSPSSYIFGEDGRTRVRRREKIVRANRTSCDATRLLYALFICHPPATISPTRSFSLVERTWPGRKGRRTTEKQKPRCQPRTYLRTRLDIAIARGKFPAPSSTRGFNLSSRGYRSPPRRRKLRGKKSVTSLSLSPVINQRLQKLAPKYL